MSAAPLVAIIVLLVAGCTGQGSASRNEPLQQGKWFMLQAKEWTLIDGGEVGNTLPSLPWNGKWFLEYESTQQSMRSARVVVMLHDAGEQSLREFAGSTRLPEGIIDGQEIRGIDVYIVENRGNDGSYRGTWAFWQVAGSRILSFGSTEAGRDTVVSLLSDVRKVDGDDWHRQLDSLRDAEG